MFNFRKFISVSAVAILGVTNLLTPLSYASAANLGEYDSIEFPVTARSFSFLMPDHHVYLYAVTEANHYFVDYNGNDGASWTMEPTEFVYDSLTWKLSPNEFVKTWYTFVDWNTQADGHGTSHESGAAVQNWLTGENARMDIYAQWSQNKYTIEYDLNDTTGTSSWVHSKTPKTWTYDESLTIAWPTRTWYDFSGWNISNMEGTHVIGWVTGTEASANNVYATWFMNLRPTAWVVQFVAQWSAKKDTIYTVNEYLEGLVDDDYSSTPDNSWTWTGETDQNVSPVPTDHEWFTTPTTQTEKIKADGSTVFTYNYERNSYSLKLIPGTWIQSVSGSWEVTASQTFTSEGTMNFKYDEQVDLSYVLKSWYTGAQWSGYLTTQSSFPMPASSWEVKEAYATAIVYTITTNTRWGTVDPANPTEYTVETPTFTLTNPTRWEHSIFSWWIGDNWSTPEKTVTITVWTTWDKTYTAVWDCVTWYHIEDAGLSTESCEADTDTRYHVNHIWQDLNWDYEVALSGYDAFGKTDTTTNVTWLEFTWFTLSGVVQTNIDWDGTAVVNAYYNRDSYSRTITHTTGVDVTATAAHSGGTAWPYLYEDTVTLSYETEDGYTFEGWTVTRDDTSASVTVNGNTFEMPASSVTIKANVSVDQYNIDYIMHSWSVAWNPAHYDVESGDIKLNTPTRDHSKFLWWSWTNHSEWFSWDTVAIPHGSTWNKTFEAMWWCDDWYHAVDDSCVANDYNVTINYAYPDWHGTTENTGFVYDRTWYIDNPSEPWYDFAWWVISWISGGNATVDGQPITDGVPTSGEGFKNLTTEENGQVTLTATWVARTDTKYEVYYLLKNLDTATYELSGTLTWTWEWETATSLELTGLAKNITGFTYVLWSETNSTTLPAGVESVTIKKDGTTKIYLYYNRQIHHVYLGKDNGVDSVTWEGDYEYGKEVEVTATLKDWYHFKEWQKRNSKDRE